MVVQGDRVKTRDPFVQFITQKCQAGFHLQCNNWSTAGCQCECHVWAPTLSKPKESINVTVPLTHERDQQIHITDICGLGDHRRCEEQEDPSVTMCACKCHNEWWRDRESKSEQTRSVNSRIDDIRDVTDSPDIRDELHKWWAKTAESDVTPMLEKLGEYGAVDLKIMGLAMQALAASKPHEITLEQGIERAIGFYLLGKVARLFGAWESSVEARDDTWYDATIYSLMGRRVREKGGWPR